MYVNSPKAYIHAPHLLEQIKLKSLLLILLTGTSVLLGLSYMDARDRLMQVSDLFEEQHVSQQQIQFNFDREVLSKLESNELGDAKQLLYSSAYMSLQSIGENDPVFNKQYQAFLTTRCDGKVAEACRMLGQHMVSESRFDEAHGVYIKAANAGDLSAMAALVELYRNKEWPGYSEEQAQVWLKKVGK